MGLIADIFNFVIRQRLKYAVKEARDGGFAGNPGLAEWLGEMSAKDFQECLDNCEEKDLAFYKTVFSLVTPDKLLLCGDDLLKGAQNERDDDEPTLATLSKDHERVFSEITEIATIDELAERLKEAPLVFENARKKLAKQDRKNRTNNAETYALWTMKLLEALSSKKDDLFGDDSALLDQQLDGLEMQVKLRLKACQIGKTSATSVIEVPGLTELLGRLSPQDFVASLDNCQDTDWRFNQTAMKYLELDKLVAFAHHSFDLYLAPGEKLAEGHSRKLESEDLAERFQKSFDDIDDVASIDDLARRLKDGNEIYEEMRARIESKGDVTRVEDFTFWAEKLVNKMYEKRDVLLGEETKLFELDNQLDSLKLGDEGGEKVEKSLEKIKERMAKFRQKNGDKAYVFYGDRQKNDCHQFADEFFGKMKEIIGTESGGECLETQIPPEDKKHELDSEELKEAIGTVKHALEQSCQGEGPCIVKVKILYDNRQAMCEYHWRTVIGKVGEKYLTVEANIGKKFLLAPEVMCLTADEVLGDGDEDARFRINVSIWTLDTNK